MVIYKIYFKSKPNLLYIGSSVNYSERKIRHRHQLKTNKHKNIYIQRLYNKYGSEELIFNIIEYVDTDLNLIKREQYYIDLLNPKLNMLKIAGSGLGYKHTQKAKDAISIKNKGRKMTYEQIQKGVISRIGQKTSKGCKRSDEYKKYLSEIKKRKVLDVSNNKIIDSITDAAKIIGIKYSTFYAKLSNRNTNDTNYILI